MIGSIDSRDILVEHHLISGVNTGEEKTKRRSPEPRHDNEEGFPSAAAEDQQREVNASHEIVIAGCTRTQYTPRYG